MENMKMLTELQEHLLTDLKILTDYEDGFFQKEDMVEKVCSLINDVYIDEFDNLENHQIYLEYETLRSHGFIDFKAKSSKEQDSLEIEEISITKKGEDYLTRIEEMDKSKSIRKRRAFDLMNIIGLASNVATLSPLMATGVKSMQGLVPLILDNMK